MTSRDSRAEPHIGTSIESRRLVADIVVCAVPQKVRTKTSYLVMDVVVAYLALYKPIGRHRNFRTDHTLGEPAAQKTTGI